ncbi:MAG: CAP domain-containing protein [Oscillospiraceae bacterium]|jgi:uncharacterized protein YkwD|nr:CAP domain-containing protein [Oscillospiraceae bacterium]
MKSISKSKFISHSKSASAIRTLLLVAVCVIAALALVQSALGEQEQEREEEQGYYSYGIVAGQEVNGNNAANNLLFVPTLTPTLTQTTESYAPSVLQVQDETQSVIVPTVQLLPQTVSEEEVPAVEAFQTEPAEEAPPAEVLAYQYTNPTTQYASQSSICPTLSPSFTMYFNGYPITVTNAAYNNGVSTISAGYSGTSSTCPTTVYPTYPTGSVSSSSCPTYTSPSYDYTKCNTLALCGDGYCGYYGCTAGGQCLYGYCPSGNCTAGGSGGNGGTITNPDYIPAPTTPSLVAQEFEVLAMINEERAANGKSQLVMDAELQELARLKSQDMAENNYFAHESPTYGNAADMLKANDYSYSAVGENISHHADIYTSHAALMASSGHRANILNASFTSAGIGIALDDRGYPLVTEIFTR